VCAQFATGVAVVTSTGSQGAAGVTVNSFTSVSLDPPMVLFCLHSRSRVRTALSESRVFAVNILTEDQETVCRSFSSRDSSDFSGMRHVEGETGAPIICDSLAYLECRIKEEYAAGDHLIVLGEVVRLDVLRHDKRPLMFFRSALHRILADC
jgi:flavin reductase (DIM6/NTAB) family NADH-FMN oxidoreductase RutF